MVVPNFIRYVIQHFTYDSTLPIWCRGFFSRGKKDLVSKTFYLAYPVCPLDEEFEIDDLFT